MLRRQRGAIDYAGVEKGKLEESVLRGRLEDKLTEAENREFFGLPVT